MKIYTDVEYVRLCEETLAYHQEEFNIRGFSQVCKLKTQWYEEQYHSAKKFSSGIKLSLLERQMLLDQHTVSNHDDFPALTAKFYLSGYNSVVCPGIDNVASEYAEQKGQSYLFYLPDIKEIEQYWEGDYLQRLTLRIDLAYISDLLGELNTAPKQLRALVENSNPQQFHFNVGSVTPQMRTIVHQIWDHPYQGAIARMYLEAKVIKLLAIQFAPLIEFKPHAVRATLKRKSIDCIYQAKNILETQLEYPPSIFELAQQVGVSERTLRRGFRELFSTTIVGYLTSLRMEKAEELLREGKLSISEIANQVGYSHLGNFSTAFKRQFGITPSQCITGKKTL
ncbi:MAG: AraC family transcriptional regulator [Cyanobacteria bacterium P01_C01_bin.72]